MEASILAGTTWLIVSRDLAWADGVARALRQLGATVHLLDTEGAGVGRLIEADAQVKLLTEGAPGPALRTALDAHPGLRWAAPVRVDPCHVWPVGRAVPDLDSLMRTCGPALRLDRDVRSRAGQGSQVVVELGELGLPRLLRALSDVAGCFVVQLSLPDADAHVALTGGQWIGASFQRRERGAERLDGMPALRAALALRAASCLVLPASRLSVPAWKQPLDSALAHALTALHASLDESLETEPTRAAAQRAPGALTAETIGPPAHRSSAAPSRRTRRTSLLLTAAGVGFAATAGLMLLLEGSGAPIEGGSVTTRSPPSAAEVQGAGLSNLRVEPLETAPVASAPDRAREGDTQAGEAAVEGATPSTNDAPPQHAAEGSPSSDRATAATADASENGRDGAGSWHLSRRLAKRATRHDDPAEARGLYEQALAQDPHNPHAVVGLARLARERGDLATAVELMERATALRRRRVSYRVLLGHVLLDAGRPDEALDAFQHALRLRPGSRRAQRGAHLARNAL